MFNFTIKNPNKSIYFTKPNVQWFGISGSYKLKYFRSNIFIMIMISSNFIFIFTNVCLQSVFFDQIANIRYFIFNSSQRSNSSQVSSIRYFVFNVIYLSIKSSFSSCVSNVRYFTFKLIYFRIKRSISSQLVISSSIFLILVSFYYITQFT